MCDIIERLEENPDYIFDLKQCDIRDEEIALAVCKAINEIERTHQLTRFEKFFNDYWKRRLRKNMGRNIAEKLEDRMKKSNRFP